MCFSIKNTSNINKEIPSIIVSLGSVDKTTITFATDAQNNHICIFFNIFFSSFLLFLLFVGYKANDHSNPMIRNCVNIKKMGLE